MQTASHASTGPLFDSDRNQTNHLEQDKFVHATPEAPLFNMITGFFYFKAMAKGPRMAEGFVDQIERRADGTYDMTKVFEKGVITTTGEGGGQVVGPRFMALADYYIATSIFGGIFPAAQDYRAFYTFRAKQCSRTISTSTPTLLCRCAAPGSRRVHLKLQLES